MGGAIDIDFDEAKFREAIAKIEQAMRDLVHTWFPKLDPYMDKFFTLLKYVTPDWAVDAAYALIKAAIEILEALANFIIDLFEGVFVPVSSFIRGTLWAKEIDFIGARSTALKDSSDKVAITWSGEGQRAFSLHAEKQVAQVDAMKACAESARNQAYIIAGATAGFYIAIGIVIAKTFAADTVAVGSTVVDGPVGPAAAAAATGIGIGEIGAIVAATVAALSVEVQAITNLTDKAKAIADTWPAPAAPYNDGSASDGDRSDWSTER